MNKTTLKDCQGTPGLPKDHLDSGPCIGRCIGSCRPRKKAPPKTPEESAEIRARAWATRREKYGKDGHR